MEDSDNDAGTGVQKANKLIDGSHINVLFGDVNSSIALALAQTANQKGVLHIVPGGHTDAVTGKNCHWSTFRVCTPRAWKPTRSARRLPNSTARSGSS